MQYLLKVVVTSILVVAIAEVSKRWSLAGAIIASLPVTSMLAMLWLFVDTNDATKVSTLSYTIFWIVVPSLVFFISLPQLLKLGLNFYLSMALASAIMAGTYWAYISVLRKFGVSI